MKFSYILKNLYPLVFFLLFMAMGAQGKETTQTEMKDEALREKAKELAQKFIVTDGHVDVPYRLNKHMVDISKRNNIGDFDYVRAKEGGVNAPFMSIYIPAKYQKSGGAKALADSLIDMVYGFTEKWPDKFAVATSVSDVHRHFTQGKISLPMGMENGAPIEGNLKNVKYFYSRGIRYITLTHAKNNHICDSSYDDEPKWNGLSPFGEKVVREMNRVGIMIDVSHITDSTFYDVMELTEAPVVATHSSCRHFTPDWERNMSDEMIRALAENGGVICINFGSAFLNSDYRGGWKQAREEIDSHLIEHNIQEGSKEAVEYHTQYRREHPKGIVEDVADHIDHVVRLVGVDHVGFGSDFDGVMFLPEGLQDVSQYPNLIYELLKRGYSEEDIEKMCGSNMLRVWSKVEKVARQTEMSH